MYKFHKERGLLNEDGFQIIQLVKTNCSEAERIRLGKILAEALNKTVKPKHIKTISDGFGNSWAKKCPNCGKEAMVVVRPGKAQCNNCE